MFEGTTACFAKVKEETFECASETTESSSEDVSVADVCAEENEIEELISEVAVEDKVQDVVDKLRRS